MSREGKCSRRLPTAALPIFRPLQELERSISETRSIYHEGRDLREVWYNKNVLVVVHVYIFPSPRPLVSFLFIKQLHIHSPGSNTLSSKAHSFSHSLDQLLLHYLPTTTTLSSNKRLLHSLHFLQHNTYTMRFQLLAIPVLAAIAEAAAISSKPSSVCTTCPVTLQNTEAAISSVLSQMAAQSPKAVLTTTSITGSPVASTAVAKMSTTAAPSSSKPTVGSSSSKPTSTSTKASSVSSSSKKRQRRAATTTAATSVSSSAPASNPAVCTPLPNYGYTYAPANPSPSAFLKDSTLRAQYMSAAVPANYVWRFAGFYASVSQAGYLFYTELSTYSPTQCASICDNNANCKGFNIYFERSPKLAPGEGCVNPAAQVNVKCAFYSTVVSEANAVNVGSWRSSFNVLITGGNGYSKM
jgi:hypothetical protein